MEGIFTILRRSCRRLRSLNRSLGAGGGGGGGGWLGVIGFRRGYMGKGSFTLRDEIM